MHPRLAPLLALLDAARAEVLAPLAGLPGEVLRRRPAPGAWTAAEILDHLARTERSVTRMLTTQLAGMAAVARADEPPPDEEADLAALARLRITDRSRRIEAPGFVRPAADCEPEAALAALAASRVALVALLEGTDPAALARVRVPHPAFGVPLAGPAWVAFVAEHERRHAAQLVEVLGSRAAGGPA